MTEIAVLGFGVVGSGTVEVLDKNSEKVAENAGQNIRVKYILDVRDFADSQYHGHFVDNFDIIVNDPCVSVVVEAIGGAQVAYEYTKACLEAGKSVVTSNKELVATHGYQLLRLANQRGVNYLFEASVGGGIPIMRPLAQCMAANQITEIYGILNGTTNYVLTEMEKNGAEFADALLDAQKKGYAEADPTADIEGHDACRKICILSSLAFGKHVYPDGVRAEGISTITMSDMQFASELGYKIKLLGRVRSVGDRMYVYVAPHLVSEEHILAGVSGVLNGVVVRGNAVGDVVFCGAGAGKLPTASAVVADIIDAVKHQYARKWIGWKDGSPDMLSDPTQLETAWYIRTDASREKIEREFGHVIYAGEKNGVIAFKTNVTSGKKLNDILARDINTLSIFRILGDY